MDLHGNPRPIESGDTCSRKLYFLILEKFSVSLGLWVFEEKELLGT
jgi:hypothetical protein